MYSLFKLTFLAVGREDEMEGGYCSEGELPSIRTPEIWLSAVLSLLGRVCSLLGPSSASLDLNIFKTKNWFKIVCFCLSFNTVL